MRVAFFGGSFDPPHRGHLAIARAAIERLAIDRVLMAPAGAQPLKLHSPTTSFGDRLAMVELAVEGSPAMMASAIDAPREDRRPNYTLEVLASMKAELQAEDELFFLLGADAFLTMRQWHRAAELLLLCDSIVAARPGFAMDDVAAALPDGVRVSRLEGAARPGVVPWRLRNEAGQSSTLSLMPDLREDISATEIRAAVAGDVSGEGVLCPAVLRYIEQRGLYR